MQYKVASVLSFLILANVYAGDDAWEVDTRYSYYKSKINSSHSWLFGLSNPSSFSSSSSYKSSRASLNLTLNDNLDENTGVHGVFTLDNLDENTGVHGVFTLDNPISETVTWPSTKTDKVRQLYLTHELENGTQIKLGKQAASFDRTKGIQELGAYCHTSLDVICDGIQSLSITTPLDENTELQVLASESRYSFIDRKQYTARVKHSTSDADYYLKLGRNDGLNPYYDGHSLGLSAEFPDKENLKDKWYADYEHTNYKGTPSHLSSMLALPEAVCGIYSSSSSSLSYPKTDKSGRLSFGRVTSVDRLLINAQVSYLREFSDYIRDRTYCEGEVPMRSYISLGDSHRAAKTATLILEYPIPNGKIVSSNSYFETYGDMSESYNWNYKSKLMSIMVMRDLSNNLSAKIGYSKNRTKQDSSYYSSRSSFDAAHVDFKYKF